MKKHVTLLIALGITIGSFAQKKELKTAEKAIKKQNFTEAKSALSSVASMLSSLDEKTLSKYHFLNAQALFAGGKGNPTDMMTALESFIKVDERHVPEVKQAKQMLENQFLTSSNQFYTNGNYKGAMQGFETLYKIKPQDTVYLYYAAASAIKAKDYDVALKHYKSLKDLNYSGEEVQYFATNKETGEDEYFNKNTRDTYVKIGTHTNPREEVSPSKRPEIIKNIAFILISKGKEDEAIQAIKDAREIDPDNSTLIIEEANIYYKKGDMNMYETLISEAVTKDPSNANLHYNIGVTLMNKGEITKARAAFEKALSINPSFGDAAINISTTYLNEGNDLVKQMNALGTSKADFDKYDRLKAEKDALFTKGAGVLESYIKSSPKQNLDILNQLKNIYSAIGDNANASRIEELIKNFKQ